MKLVMIQHLEVISTVQFVHPNRIEYAQHHTFNDDDDDDNDDGDDDDNDDGDDDSDDDDPF